ncbi:acyl carrier protein [Streptomyces sp. NPDC088350]|uniref:acyl carrier protein n=1 Tax=Streptomyces sp. NPDC088350 TaxID=3365854 RepID=UPI0037FC6524
MTTNHDGDSLMGLEISVAVRRRFDIELPAVRIIGGATLTELARTIRTDRQPAP